MSAVGADGWYVIQLHERGEPIVEMFYPTHAQLDERVNFYKGGRLYRRIWWGSCPTTDRNTWEELGDWERP
jgi:hypothetical protein